MTAWKNIPDNRQGGMVMDIVITEIEKHCHEKLMIYKDLLGIFRSERKAIINADVSALWRYTSEKQEKAGKIMAIRKDILKILNERGLLHNMSEVGFDPGMIPKLLNGKRRKTLGKVTSKIRRIRENVRISAEANRKFIEEYLKTISELVNVVAGNDNETSLYNQQKNADLMRNQANALIYREV